MSVRVGRFLWFLRVTQSKAHSRCKPNSAKSFITHSSQVFLPQLLSLSPSTHHISYPFPYLSKHLYSINFSNFWIFSTRSSSVSAVKSKASAYSSLPETLFTKLLYYDEKQQTKNWYLMNTDTHFKRYHDHSLSPQNIVWTTDICKMTYVSDLKTLITNEYRAYTTCPIRVTSRWF